MHAALRVGRELSSPGVSHHSKSDLVAMKKLKQYISTMIGIGAFIPKDCESVSLNNIPGQQKIQG